MPSASQLPGSGRIFSQCTINQMPCVFFFSAAPGIGHGPVSESLQTLLTRAWLAVLPTRSGAFSRLGLGRTFFQGQVGHGSVLPCYFPPGRGEWVSCHNHLEMPQFNLFSSIPRLWEGNEVSPASVLCRWHTTGRSPEDRCSLILSWVTVLRMGAAG